MHNEFKTINRALGEDSLNQPVPSYCCFVVTLRCMMKCKMCYIWESSQSYHDELTIQEWKNVVRSLDGLLDKKHDIILSGGEPFLKKDILDLVHFSSQSGYRVSLDTNAYLIDMELAKAIGDSGLWRICISLDSLDENTHDFLRGKEESYHRAMKAIEYLHKLCPAVGINIQTVIMERNLNELTRFAEWVNNDPRLDYIYFQVVARPFGAAVSEQWFKDPQYNFLWPQDMKRVEAVIKELIQLKDTNSKIVNSAAQLKSQLAYFQNPLHFAQEQDCSIGNRDININPQGEVYLCFSKDPIGSVRIDSLKKIWYSEQASKVREGIKECRESCHFSLNCSFE